MSFASEGRGLTSAETAAAQAAPPTARPKLKPLLALSPYVLRYRWIVAGAIVALLIAALATLAVPLAVRRMIDYGFSADHIGLIDQYFAALIAIAAVLAGASAARYYLVTAVAAVLVAAAVNLVRTRTGRAFLAIRESEIAAQASGVEVARYKAIAFALSAFYTGVAGGLFAFVVGFLSPDAFDVFLSVDFVVMIIVGGLGSVPGSIIGAGTSTIEIEGVDELSPVDHVVIPDRIEAATYLAAVGIAGGEITVEGATGFGLLPSSAACLGSLLPEAGSTRVVTTAERPFL